MQNETPLPPKVSLAERIADRLLTSAGTASFPDVLPPASGTSPEGQASVAVPVFDPPAQDIPVTIPVQAPVQAIDSRLRGAAGAEVAEGYDGSSDQPSIKINFRRLQAEGFITPDSPRSAQTEEFRIVKRHLLKGAFSEGRKRRSRNSNVVMVTSSIPGEGKTFMSLNLAMSLSVERDLYVLLVDADSHRQTATDWIGVAKGLPGLVDLLLDPTMNVRDCMLRTNIPNLSFLPAGRPHSHASELLASKEMGSLMTDLANRYPDRMIIIDTPPLLASTEGVVLASYVGTSIVVVEKDRTTRQTLRRSLSLLEGCENVTCILNKDNADRHFGDYGYGYESPDISAGEIIDAGGNDEGVSG